MPEFEHRGVIEGFYGAPYAHADRLWWVERLADWGMNRYVHAPKDDPLHRAEWRAPYPADALGEFAELIDRGARRGVEVGFAVSPGLSMVYSSPDDLAALVCKLAAFRERGARFFSLAVDDVPTELAHDADRRAFGSLAEAHVAVAHALRESLGTEVTLCVVPTDYMGTNPTPYLEEMGETLHPDIQVGWTGRTVVSPTVTSAEAKQRAQTLRRRLILWDNYPVADGPMRGMLHLGAYEGRDRDLADHLSGVILNPMEHARASGVAVYAAAVYMSDPVRYDPEAAWAAGTRAVCADGETDEVAEAFQLFARAHRFSALTPDQRDEPLEQEIRALRVALETDGDALAERVRVRDLLGARQAAAESLSGLRDRRLAHEIAPWLESYADESRRMLIALDCIDAFSPGRSRLDRALAYLGMEGRLTRIATPSVASYGPRRVCYPQLVCMHDDAAAFGEDPILYTDRCLSDELVDLATERAQSVLRG